MTVEKQYNSNKCARDTEQGSESIEDATIEIELREDYIEEIAREELDKGAEKTKIRKIGGSDDINLEIIKYLGIEWDR